MPTNQEQCARLAVIKGEMEGVLKAADGRAMTVEETASFDALNTEADGLKTSIKADIEATRVRQDRADKLSQLTDFCDTTTTLGPSRDAPDNGEQLSKPTAKRYTGKLLGFANNDDAFKAGLHLLSSIHHLSRDGIGDLGVWADRKCRDIGVKLSVAQSEGDNTRGGYLVHESMETAIVKLREQYGVVRREFAPKAMVSDTQSWPREVGNHTVYYPEENGEITASTMKWDQCTITAKKMASLGKISKELNEDAVVNMADEQASSMAWKFAYAEDLDGFIGDGTSTYGGMTGIVTKLNDASGVTYAGSIHTALAGNTAFSTLDLVDFESMLGMLPEYADPAAKWYISKAGWAASMLRLIDAAGGNTGDMLSGKAPRMFLGYPVVVVNVMNKVLTAQTSTAGLCLLGDLRKCCFLGDRRKITIDTSTERYFEYDQIAIKATQRVGVTCTPGDPAAPTTAAGPVIMLSTPGS